MIISFSHFIKYKFNNNRTHTSTNNCFISNSFTSTISNLTITLWSHITFHFSSLFNLLNKLSKFSNIIIHSTFKITNILCFNKVSIIFIINIKYTISSHTIYSFSRFSTKKRFSNHKNIHLIFSNSHFSMIRNYITKYLIRNNCIYNTKSSKTGKKFCNTIIRKFTIPIISNRTSLIRIYACSTRTNSNALINLWTPHPFNTNITISRVKLISFINNSCCNKCSITICKNTFFYFTSPNSMPNFK